MYARQIMSRLAFILAPALVASELSTVTKYASTCSIRTPGSSAIYTSGTNTHTSPASPPTIAAISSSTPTSHAAVCPDYNGQNYTSPSGGMYGVSCDLAINGTTLPGLYIRDEFVSGAIYQEGCIIACQKSDACVALTVSVGSCTFYSNVTGTIDAIGSAALIKRAAPPVASTTSSASTSAIDRTVVSTLVYTTTIVSQQTTTAVSTAVSLVPTTVVSVEYSTATSLVPTTIQRTLTQTAISSVPYTVVSTTVKLSTSTLVTTIDQTRFVTATTQIPITIVSTYVSTAFETVYFPSVTTAISQIVSTVFFPSTTISISLVPTTLTTTAISSFPVTTTLVRTETSLVPTTRVETLVTTERTTATATETTVSSFGVTIVETTLEVSTATSTQRVTATPSVIVLPNNLGTQFGGVDITKGFKNPNFIRPGLWNLGGLDGNDYETHTVYYGDKDGQWTYQVPDFLAFSWASQLNTETVTGETKSDYQRKLSQSLSANIGFAGFGLEVQDTFEEETLVETYHKYASIYARQQIYRVSIREFPATLQSYLSDRARRLFAAGDAKAIVDTFGTHYMSSASFGGMRRFASSIDVRDESISTKLGQALKLKFAAETEAGEVSGGASSDNSDATVKKLRDSMETKSSIVFGGTYIDGSETWIPSLYRNPAAIDFELGSITELILDVNVKAAVKAEIELRMQTSQVTSSASALVMWEGLGDLRTDKGSGADAGLSTATVNRKQGWFTLGQYGVAGYDWDPSRSKGLLIRNIPGSTQQLVKKPDSIQRRWGKSSSYGLYEMASGDPNYHALSGFWYGTDNAQFSQLETDRAGMVHTSLTVATTPNGQLWNDGGSGAKDNADVQRVYYGASDDDSIRIQQLPDGQPEAYFFHTNGAPGDGQYRRLDFSKVQFVSNNFINPP